ncbi:MAG TPA: hypothetical protein PKL78_00265 [Anaerolineales bacterium]|nr:hypothetical protein [Anaerolineales bacterium]HNN11961.1 hypothetical protein [Anaerolineales bacterium]
MSIWRRLLSVIGLRPLSAPRNYQISESMHVTLTTLSQHDVRPEDELLQDLLAAGLTQCHSFDELWHKWETLSLGREDGRCEEIYQPAGTRSRGILHIFKPEKEQFWTAGGGSITANELHEVRAAVVVVINAERKAELRSSNSSRGLTKAGLRKNMKVIN